MRTLTDYKFKEFRIGQIVVFDNRFKVKFIGSNYGKAQISFSGHTRYVEFNQLKSI